MISTTEVQSLLEGGGEVVGQDGEKIGKIGQVYLDDESGQPEWVTVKTGMFGGAESFVPIAAGSVSGQELQVPYDKAMVKDAPQVEDTDGHLSKDQEADLYRYYGLENAADHSAPDTQVYDQTQDTADTAGRFTEGRDTSGPTTDQAMTRSEEQLKVGTEKVETGKARLRKYVVTEQQTVTVPVTREEVRIEREPITEANRDEAMAGPAISEEEHEVTLHEEQVVVAKEAIPVERVRMGTETVTEDQQVTEEVRKEQIETEGVHHQNDPQNA